ncbi:MAG: PilZ domain-containing protein [Spirochaetia bacterium]|nr:PilZ domain-containing protein [Spirochaetia bacterium]
MRALKNTSGNASKYHGTERRKTPRFDVEQFVIMSMNREDFIRGKGVNISHDGILCHTKEKVELMSRVFLMLGFDLHHEHHDVNVEGVVMRSEPFRSGRLLGIHFTEMSPEGREKIDELIRASHRLAS